jgi:esterase/lipase
MKKLFLFCIISISNIGIFAQNHYETDKKDLQFESNGFQLSGVLITPKTDKKAPLIIVVPNSWSPRFVSIAEYFATNGIACFTYDSRDVGKSMGFDCFKDSIVDIYSQDLQIIIKTLSSQQNFSKVGVLGISMGGFIVERAIVKENVDYYVMMSTPTMSFKDSYKWMVESFTKHKVDSAQLSYLNSVRESVLNSHDYEFMPYDYVKRIRANSLWIFGQNDINISVDQSITDLEAIKKTNNNSIKKYEGLDHNGVSESEMVINEIIQWIIE